MAEAAALALIALQRISRCLRGHGLLSARRPVAIAAICPRPGSLVPHRCTERHEPLAIPFARFTGPRKGAFLFMGGGWLR